MNENLPDIDDLFKKAFEKADDEPSFEVWQKIDKQLDKRRVVSLTQKYRKWKWVAAACLIFSAGMAMYAIRTKIISKQPAEKTTGTFKPTENNRRGGQNVPTSKNNIAPDQQSNEAAGSQPYPQKAPADTINISESITRGATAESVNLVAGNQQAVKSGLIKLNGKVQGHLPDKVATNNALIQKENIRPITKSSTQWSLPPVAKNTSNLLQQNDEHIRRGKYGQATNIKDWFEPLYRVSLQTENIHELNSDAGSARSIKFLAPSANDRLNQLEVDNTRQLKSYAKTAGLSRLSASVFYSIEAAGTHTTNERPRFREDERNFINDNEKSKQVSTKGLLIGLALNNKWSIETGITTTSITTQFKPKTIYARPDDNGRVNFRFSCAAGTASLILKQGNPPAPGDSIYASSSNNRLQYIGIPLSIRYLIPAGKFSFQPGVGVSPFILSGNQIQTNLSTAAGNQKITSDNITGLKKTYVNGMLSLKASYNINKFISLDFTPAARFGLSAINQQTPVKTNLNTIGAGFGLSYKIL